MNNIITVGSSKVWLKTKYDYGMKMDIPHSDNIAHALYGFNQLGAEVVPYHTIKEIYYKVGKNDIVLDYIDQCKVIFDKFDVQPKLDDYPDCMKEFLHRKIWTDTINSISSNKEKWTAGWFVKPVRGKAFTGKIISSIHDLVGCGNHSENYDVLCSEAIDIKAEWRCFIYKDEIIDIRPYGQLIDADRQSWKYSYDPKVVEAMLERFKTWEERPAACSMDIAVAYTPESKDILQTVLVEFNDCYALGNYGLPSLFYAKMISARWSQLLGREDEYDFE